MLKHVFENAEEYFADFPPETQTALEAVRAAIKKAAPEAVECIAYAMPAFKMPDGKPLVYYAGYKNHVGFYATPTGHAAFSDELSKYKQGKGSAQFPLTEPMPVDLIERIAAFRWAENFEKAKLKKSSKKR